MERHYHESEWQLVEHCRKSLQDPHSRSSNGRPPPVQYARNEPRGCEGVGGRIIDAVITRVAVAKAVVRLGGQARLERHRRHRKTTGIVRFL
jgi:hypothetical protein